MTEQELIKRIQNSSKEKNKKQFNEYLQSEQEKACMHNEYLKLKRDFHTNWIPKVKIWVSEIKLLEKAGFNDEIHEFFNNYKLINGYKIYIHSLSGYEITIRQYGLDEENYQVWHYVDDSFVEYNASYEIPYDYCEEFIYKFYKNIKELQLLEKFEAEFEKFLVEITK